MVILSRLGNLFPSGECCNVGNGNGSFMKDKIEDSKKANILLEDKKHINISKVTQPTGIKLSKILQEMHGKYTNSTTDNCTPL